MTFAARPHVPAAVAVATGVVASATYSNWDTTGHEPVAVTVSVQVNTNGTVTVEPGGTVLGNWFTPTTVGAGTGYRVRFQVAGDTFTGLTANTFYALSSARAVTFSAPPNYSGSSVLTVQIATDASATIIGTGTVVLSLTNTWE